MKKEGVLMGRNVGLLEATMQKIADHPELHDQSSYFTQTDCGTAACFAGWACILSGGQPWFAAGNEFTSAVRYPGDQWAGAAVSAMNLLGLTDDEAVILFDAGNSRRMLELMTKDLVNGDELMAPDDYRELTHR